MAIRGAYNDPALGQAFESLASLFAPMSGSEVAGYAAADLNRQKALAEAQRNGLIEMYAAGQGGDAAGIAAGLYTPNQSWGAVQLGDATDRRGQDLSLQGTIYGADRTYDASTQNNVRDNARALELGTMADATARYGHDADLRGSVFGSVAAPLAPGEVRNVPANIMEWALGTSAPALDQAGTPKPLTDAEVEGGLMTDLAARDPEVARWLGMGSPDPIAVVGADGPVMTMPHQAAGMGVYEKPTADSVKLTNVRLPDGRQTVAVQTAAGLVDPSSGAAMPPGTTMFSTAAQGAADDVGLGKTTTGKVEQQMLEIGTAVGTAKSLRQMIADNGASQGVVGWARMTAQDLMQTSTEVGRAVGGTTAEVAGLVNEGVLDAGLASEMFDPSLPAINMLGNMLAFQYAKSMTGERLSNEMLRTARKSLGLDKPLANQADSIARLDMAITQLEQQQRFLQSATSTGAIGQMTTIGVPGAPAPAPPPTAGAVPAVGAIEDGHRFRGGDPADPANWEVVR